LADEDYPGVGSQFPIISFQASEAITEPGRDAPMVNVFLHYRNEPTDDWINEQREFGRIPCVGEYVKPFASGDCHRVYLVLHCAFEFDYKAEVFTNPAGSLTDAITAREPVTKLSPVVGQVTKVANTYAARALARVNEGLTRLTEKK
jgi:hypothetical protein